jgi:hypothetical protein
MRKMRLGEVLSQDGPKSGRKTKPTSRGTSPGHALCMPRHGERHGRPFEWCVDRGPPCMRDIQCLSTFDRRKNPRRATPVGVPAAAVYTGGHLLEFHRKTATSRNFSARPARLPDGNARSASRVMRSRSGLTRGFQSDQDPSLQGPPKTAISNSACCSPRCIGFPLFPLVKTRLVTMPSVKLKNRRNRSYGTITLASVCHCGIHFYR